MENKDYIKNIQGAERRYFASEVRASKTAPVDPEDTTEVFPLIEGYAAKYNSVTTIGWCYKYEEEILPGAFDDVLNDDVRCLFNHDPNYVLARSNGGKGTLTLTSDEVGLKYSYVTPDISYAEDLAVSIDLGNVSQSSFAFEIAEETWIIGDSEKGILDKRQIKKFKRLYDVSPVTYPAYEDTEVAQRSIEGYKKLLNMPVVEEEVVTGMSVRAAQLQINKNLL